MNAPNPITIVGGGLAGLALGIGLRQQGIPVMVWEAGSYPRHKVCGEFISGRGQETLARLGLLEKLHSAGARLAVSSSYHVPGMKGARQTLPKPALCLSRYVLDALLAEECARLGGELRSHQRWSGDFSGVGVVRADGHRVQASVHGWRWFGLKVHVQRAELESDLELHLFRDGYVGLCRLSDCVNVCGLFRSQDAMPDLRERWREYLLGSGESALRDRLRNAEFAEESFRAVAGLCVEPSLETNENECVLGDALTMIPPATGNGMSMALEAAELATEPLARYSRGDSSWAEARNVIRRACRERFAPRLKTAAQLHTLMFQPVERRLLMMMGRCVPATWRFLFAHTR